MTDILRLSNANIEIELWSIGARLNRVAAFGETGLVAACETEADALGAKRNYGAVVGVVANRLAKSQAPVLNQVYQLEPGTGGAPICHCGDQGVNTRNWTVTDESSTHATFTLALTDGEDAMPGNRQLTTTYRLTDTGFDVTFGATTDAPTLMNLALHPYWSLAQKGRSGQQLMVNAAGYLPIDKEKIPLGRVEEVDGIFDLRTIATPSTNIDHNYDLTARAHKGPAARLASATLQLDIDTDAPGLQVYTGSPDGIAIEPQHWPDAPHHANFPSILLSPGEAYAQSSTYRFSRL